MQTGRFSSKDESLYNLNGYVIVRGLFNGNEVQRLLQVMEEDLVLQANLAGRADGHGGESDLGVWNSLGANTYGYFAGADRMVKIVHRLMGYRPGFYHQKISSKKPGKGGIWNWHQDGFYFAAQGCLYGDLISAAIALDPCNVRNGCMKLIPGSHSMNLFPHGVAGEQFGIEQRLVTHLVKRLEQRPVLCEMDVGDVLFFHQNVLHCSGPNRSKTHRRLHLSVYLSQRADPVYPKCRHAHYKRIQPFPDSAIMDCAPRGLNSRTPFVKRGAVVKGHAKAKRA